MDQQFQTSFIPKKPMTEARAPVSRASVSFFMILATIILVVSAFMLGGAFFYKYSMQKRKDALTSYIDKKLSEIEAETPVLNRLIQVDRRIQAANEVLKNHIMISPIFTRLEQLTLKSIQYTKFEYVGPKDASSSVSVKMAGRATNYAAVAVQSDVLTGSNGANTYFLNPIFSNLNLDDKARVSFDLTFGVDRDLISYPQIIKRSTAVTTTDNSLQ